MESDLILMMRSLRHLRRGGNFTNNINHEAHDFPSPGGIVVHHLLFESRSDLLQASCKVVTDLLDVQLIIVKAGIVSILVQPPPHWNWLASKCPMRAMTLDMAAFLTPASFFDKSHVAC